MTEERHVFTVALIRLDTVNRALVLTLRTRVIVTFKTIYINYVLQDSHFITDFISIFHQRTFDNQQAPK